MLHVLAQLVTRPVEVAVRQVQLAVEAEEDIRRGVAVGNFSRKSADVLYFAERFLQPYPKHGSIIQFFHAV